jgi:hypothetical protein
MTAEHWWNGTDKEKPKYTGKNLSKCNFAHHKSNIQWPGMEIGPPK